MEVPVIVNKIQQWLNDPENVTNEKRFQEGTLLLLSLTRNKYQVNYLNKGWKSNIQKSRLIYELQKHLRIKLSGVTLQQIEDMKPEVERIGREIAEISNAESCAKTKESCQEKDIVPIANEMGTKPSAPLRGKRPDHDMLPKHIQALYVETHNILVKERALHERLKLMEDAKPCDRHEFVTMLINLDKKRHMDWEEYDSYVIGSEPIGPKEFDIKDPSPIQTVTVNPAADAVSIGNCRTFISRNIEKALKLKKDVLKVAEYTRLLADMKAKYVTAVGLGAKFSDKTIEKLKEAGVEV